MLCSCLSLGLPNPEGSGGGEAKTGVWRGSTERKTGGGEEGTEEKEEEECRRRGERERMWPEPWGLAKSPSLSSAPSPPSTQPLPAASLYTMAASLLKFHVIGSRAWSFVLPQCPGSRACCRGDTLCKLKAGKPFLLSLALEKGRKVPPPSPPPPPLFFHHPLSSPSLPCIKTGGRLSSSVKLH